METLQRLKCSMILENSAIPITTKNQMNMKRSQRGQFGQGPSVESLFKI